jgi:hypothetical protein
MQDFATFIPELPGGCSRPPDPGRKGHRTGLGATQGTQKLWDKWCKILHSRSLLALNFIIETSFFCTIFLIFSAIVQDKRPFFTTFDYISLLGAADGTATFQFSPATSKSIDVPECCIKYTPSEHDSNSQH